MLVAKGPETQITQWHKIKAGNLTISEQLFYLARLNFMLSFCVHLNKFEDVNQFKQWRI